MSIFFIILLSLFLFNMSLVSSTSSTSKLVYERKGKLQFPTKATTSFDYLQGKMGYCDISAGKGERMFYYFFNERTDKSSPVVLWLAGIPGFSSSFAVFRENGPFRIIGDRLNWTEYGYDKGANMIYVDEPMGTRLSYTNEYSYVRKNAEQVTNDLYNFLQVFFGTHDAYQNNNFFIAGRSYAGKYAPLLARKIYERNEVKTNIKIHLQGVAIGNGYVNPTKQFGSIPQFVREYTKLNLNEDDQRKIDEASKKCQSSAQQCDKTGLDSDCMKAYTDCEIILLGVISGLEGGTNIYDYTKKNNNNLKHDNLKIETYLNMELEKRNLRGDNKQFHLFKRKIHDAMREDYMKNADGEVAYLINRDINVLIYMGENDISSNLLGNMKWATELEWKNTVEFQNSKDEELFVDGDMTSVGVTFRYGPFIMDTIDDAGHFVAINDPKTAFHLMKDWMKHTQTKYLSDKV